MEQSILSPLKLELSISNDRGDKIVHMQHELIDHPENPTEDQINQTLQEITKSVATWLEQGLLLFEAYAPHEDGQPTIEFNGETQKFPTEIIVFRAKLPVLRDGFIKGAKTIMLRKDF